MELDRLLPPTATARSEPAEAVRSVALGGRTFVALQRYARWEEGRDYRVPRILIVDDEPDIRFMMRLIFEVAGYTVTEARHGATGLKSVKATPPDLVVTDVMMPTMDGPEFIKRLRSNPETAAIPILVVSGNSELATAANTRVPKPFLPQKLLDAVALLIREDGG
jgi:CheY-like chemotaxis protein